MITPLTAFMSPGGGELIIILLALILLFGAKDAPRILREIMNHLGKLQRSAADFRYKLMYSDLYKDTPEPPRESPVCELDEEPGHPPGEPQETDGPEPHAAPPAEKTAP